MASKYNAEGYYSPTEYEAFTRVEKEERAAKRAADFRPIVYICSPYSGNVNHNIEMARKYSRFAVDNGLGKADRSADGGRCRQVGHDHLQSGTVQPQGNACGQISRAANQYQHGHPSFAMLRKE